MLAGAGYADNLERGPARHGISNALFVYFRDPDGNRFELYTGDYLTGDISAEPIRWSLNNPVRQTLWGAPPPRRWFEESMAVETFDGSAMQDDQAAAAAGGAELCSGLADDQSFLENCLG